MSEFRAAKLADLHNHLLPGVDDGARTLDESLRHLRAMAADGVTRLGVSPHLNGTLAHDGDAAATRLDELESAFHEVERACAGREDVPDLVFGQEIFVPDVATAIAIMAEPRAGIAGTDYALIEFGFYLDADAASIVRAVVDAGRRPIVAHPERYLRHDVQVEIGEIQSWKEAGGLLQVNAGSLLGRYGAEIAALAWRLLSEGLIDLVSTDHHGDSRIIMPAAAGRALADRGAAAQARLLLSENPQRVLDGRSTVPVEPCVSEIVA